MQDSEHCRRVVFCFSEIPVLLAEQAASTPNVQALGAKDAPEPREEQPPGPVDPAGSAPVIGPNRGRLRAAKSGGTAGTPPRPLVPGGAIDGGGAGHEDASRGEADADMGEGAARSRRLPAPTSQRIEPQKGVGR